MSGTFSVGYIPLLYIYIYMYMHNVVEVKASLTHVSHAEEIVQ